MVTVENEVWQAAKDVLFKAQLAEIRELAEDSFRSLGVPIGSMLISQCTQCGAPIGHADDRDYRTEACRKECQ